MKKTRLFFMVVAVMATALLQSCGNSGSGGGASLGGLYLFPADDGQHGIELWRSDGTGEGTSLLADAYPSYWPSNPMNITKAGSYVYFVADDGTHGYELWATDGTAAGTRMVKDINPAGSLPPGSPPGPAAPVLSAGMANIQGLTDVNGTLYFTADDYVSGRRVWTSDGTANGTVLITANTPTGFWVNTLFSEISGTVYFGAYADASGNQLWKTDGTDGGTVPVGAATCSNPWSLTNVNGTLYFNGFDVTIGQTLCKSDGTPGGTVAIGSAGPTGSYNPDSITNVDGAVFFTGDDGTNGRELWVSNGTTTGTFMVKDINPGVDMGSYPSNLTAVNGTLFFTADDGTHGIELWKSDGTEAGTVMVKDILTPQTVAKLKKDGPAIAFLGNGSTPIMLQNVNGTLMFFANDGYHGYEPWRSDGTTTGTSLIKDINFGTNSALPVVNIVN